MALPILQSLKDKYPHAEVTWVSGKASLELLQGLPDLEHVITLCEKKLLFGSFFQKSFEVLKLWGRLFFKRYDLSIIAHNDKRYQMLGWSYFAKERRALSQKKYRFVPFRYHGWEYLRLLNVDPDQLIWPKLQLPHDIAIRGHIALAPGGDSKHEVGKALRSWPIDSYVALAKLLLQKGFKVAILGGEKDHWVEPYFADLPVTSCVGSYSLTKSIAFLKQSLALITHDSGPMHMGVLANVPTIGLFGPTIPNEKLPNNEAITWVWGGEHLPCRPCYNGKAYASCANPLCMKQITPEQVFEKLKGLL